MRSAVLSHRCEFLQIRGNGWLCCFWFLPWSARQPKCNRASLRADIPFAVADIVDREQNYGCAAFRLRLADLDRVRSGAAGSVVVTNLNSVFAGYELPDDAWIPIHPAVVILRD